MMGCVVAKATEIVRVHRSAVQGVVNAQKAARWINPATNKNRVRRACVVPTTKRINGSVSVCVVSLQRKNWSAHWVRRDPFVAMEPAEQGAFAPKSQDTPRRSVLHKPVDRIRIVRKEDVALISKVLGNHAFANKTKTVRQGIVKKVFSAMSFAKKLEPVRHFLLYSVRWIVWREPFAKTPAKISIATSTAWRVCAVVLVNWASLAEH
jgi:hypothetical protein